MRGILAHGDSCDENTPHVRQDTCVLPLNDTQSQGTLVKEENMYLSGHVEYFRHKSLHAPGYRA